MGHRSVFSELMTSSSVCPETVAAMPIYRTNGGREAITKERQGKKEMTSCVIKIQLNAVLFCIYSSDRLNYLATISYTSTPTLILHGVLANL